MSMAAFASHTKMAKGLMSTPVKSKPRSNASVITVPDPTKGSTTPGICRIEDRIEDVALHARHHHGRITQKATQVGPRVRPGFAPCPRLRGLQVDELAFQCCHKPGRPLSRPPIQPGAGPHYRLLRKKTVSVLHDVKAGSPLAAQAELNSACRGPASPIRRCT